MASRNAKLIDLLAAKQRQGKLAWEETERPKTFQVAFSQSAVRISERAGEDDTDDIWISVFDEQGRLLEEFSDVDLKNEVQSVYSKMYELYEAARRAALGVDKALDSLIDELDDL
jgi:hypothetical protein